MLLYLLAFLGGVLTILSPCILPVLPFVFARADQPFRRAGLPLLVGMALTFAAVATAAAYGGHWIARLNQGGRYIAMAIFLVLGLTLLFPSLAEALTRPLVRAGSQLQGGPTNETSVGRSLLLGISTGLLWAPCAGPVLGLILTGAALQGPGVRSSLLLLVYALGAACSLAIALLAGKKVLSFMKGSLAYDVWIRRALGVAVIAGVIAIALGWDTNLLTKFSFVNTASAEERLLRAVKPGNAASSEAATTQQISLPDEGPMPDLTGAVGWINSGPLDLKALRGKVVVIDFWTYSCINCLRALPYVEAWSAKYKDSGLVVIGVHTPEFAFEKERSNVEQAVRDLKITYPVAIDSDYNIWRAFKNQYWPAHYFIDGKGRIRYHHFGEGEYDQSEKVIQQLLKENGAKSLSTTGPSGVAATGVEAAPDNNDVRSPETYVGYERAANFASAQPVAQDSPKNYTPRPRLSLNQWALNGKWTVGAESAVLSTAPGKIVFRFHARDLHLVLGPSNTGKPIRFVVKIDGTAPGEDHGSDVDATGAGTVQGHRLYQLIRQKGAVEDRTFEIEFLDPGVQAFAFTFG
jgi:cytochrome c biogenesis protein CcdA/thiol-disulfide isomerase/thioredoxin